ncbi:MAG: ACP S-malonyltransferase [Candidatus Levybacteria bacterium]|nr:ACP S-malonyltransferase [Candidatus Levybacteria bacterium]
MPPRAEVLYTPPIEEVKFYTDKEGKRSTVIMFPGQGTQYVGMGKELCTDDNSEVQTLYREAEEVFGRSLLGLTEEDLSKTLWAQPAIFVHSEARRLVLAKQNPVTPPFYLGNSLGIYNALYAAGAFHSFKDALFLIKARAESMQKACDLVETGLFAFLIRLKDGQTISEKQKAAFEELRERFTNNDLGRYLEADINESQFVAGATKANIAEMKQEYEEWLQNWAQEEGYEDVEQARNDLGFAFVDIDVSGAFHSPYMTNDRADRDFKLKLMKTRFRKTRVPVIANTTALPIQTPEEIREELYDHLDKPVLLRQSFDFLESQGVKILWDIGEKGVMARIARARGKMDIRRVAVGASAAAGAAAITIAVVYFRRRREKY